MNPKNKKTAGKRGEKTYIISGVPECEVDDFNKRLLDENIDTEMIKITSAKEFKDAMDNIRAEVADKNIIPTICLDVHGNKSQELCFEDGSKIHFSDAAESLRNLNCQCQGRLDILAGVCFGGGINEYNDKRKFPAFRTLIGSEDRIWDGDFYRGSIEYLKARSNGKSVEGSFLNFKNVIPKGDYSNYEMFKRSKPRISESDCDNSCLYSRLQSIFEKTAEFLRRFKIPGIVSRAISRIMLYIESWPSFFYRICRRT